MNDVRRHWCQGKGCTGQYSCSTVPTECRYCGGTKFRSESDLERWYIDNRIYHITDAVVIALGILIWSVYVTLHMICGELLFNYLFGW